MININNLSFHYTKKNPLFEDLSLNIPEGNIYGLLGKNGAGKTTLLKLISGLIFPKTGVIDVFGYQPMNRRPDFLADICIIPEELFVPKHVNGATYIKRYSVFYPKFDQTQFEGYLKTFDIPMDKKLTELSYGQKKKFLLCFGIACNTRLLILDEPTNGLDIPSKSQFRSLLAGAMTDDRTVIISTHQVRDMANLIDPIIILEDGEIVFQQSLEAVTRHLYFETVSNLDLPENAIYSERIPGGHYVVTENVNGYDSEVDLEVLFNAVTTNRSMMNALFSKRQGANH